MSVSKWERYRWKCEKKNYKFWADEYYGKLQMSSTWTRVRT